MRITSTILTLLILCAAQVGLLLAQEYLSCNGLPYNPDADCDGVIGTFDFLPFAALFGEAFTADFNTLSLPDSLDPDPTNELQWLAIDGDTLHLLLADSTIYSSVYIGGADGADGMDGANGADGMDGADGVNGADGLSAYEIWLTQGNEGTEDDFFASLMGPEGPQGPAGQNGLDGANGINGTNGTDGTDGADGLSAYEIWLAAGNTGNEADFLVSLIGAPGEQGEAGAQGPQGPEGPQGPAGEPGAEGADGAAGLSAYEIWLELGNTGTEQDFIAYLSGGAAFSPSVHGVFDSETDGNTFEIAEAIATVSVELWGASGGSGGDICGQTLGASSCNLCDATGGAGGRALKVVNMVYNLAQGDVLTLVPAAAGADSGELITCNPGLTGWTNWDCGPASSGADAGTTQLLLNGEVIAEISGGMGGTGACIGCQGDGCFNGDPGADGALSNSANWMTVLSTQTLEDSTGSRVILRY